MKCAAIVLAVHVLSVSAGINLTIGAIASYCTMRYMNFNSSLGSNFTEAYDPAIIVDLVDNSGFVYYQDIAVLAAIRRVNSDPSILPNITVTLKRFSDCGPYDPNAASDYAGFSAGYAAAITASDVTEIHTDVIGVIGDQYSTATRGVAQILSNAQIPYCASAAGSPRFSNKAIYPYLWRTFAVSYAKQCVLILRHWGVKRVGIVYQSDNELGRANLVTITNGLVDNGITVTTTIGLTSAFDEKAGVFACKSINRTDTRYIVNVGLDAFVTNVLYSLGPLGCVRENIVWMAISFPKIDSVINDYLRGLVVFRGSFNEIMPSFMQEVDLITQAHLPERYLYFNSYATSYDCAMMMLLGFDKLLKSNPSFSSEMLSSRKLQNLMNFTLFQHLNYDGMTADDITLDSFGNLASPSEYLTLLGENLTTRLFATSDLSASTINFYNTSLPIFRDGSARAPPDGPTFDYFKPSSALQRMVMMASTVAGMSLTLFCFLLILFHNTSKAVRAAAIPETLTLLVGCCLSYCGLLLYMDTPARKICHARVAVLLTSFGLTVSPLVFKSLFLIDIFASGKAYRNRAMLRKTQLKYRFANCMFILFEVAIAIVWFLKSQADTKAVFDATLGLNYLVCNPRSNANLALVIGVYVFNLALCAALVYTSIRQRSIESSAHNEATTMIVLMITLALGFTLIEGINALESDGWTDFKVALCIFIFTSAIVIGVILPIILDLYQEFLSARRYAALDKNALRSQSREVSRTSERELSFQLSSSPHVRKTSFTTEISGRTCSYKYQLLQHTTEFVTWRLSSPLQCCNAWHLGVASVHSINAQKVWFSIATFRKTVCIPLPDNDSWMQARFGKVTFPRPKSQLGLEIEFGDNVEAAAFLEELKKFTKMCYNRKYEMKENESTLKGETFLEMSSVMSNKHPFAILESNIAKRIGKKARCPVVACGSNAMKSNGVGGAPNQYGFHYIQIRCTMCNKRCRLDAVLRAEGSISADLLGEWEKAHGKLVPVAATTGASKCRR
ncbi:periplasmic binding protein-like I [Chytriomyces cf. hyalinus JEL632]|nr:periplasmic binding protein-like I [Chytriomyces cf. hyalinus JEL632]